MNKLFFIFMLCMGVCLHAQAGEMFELSDQCQEDVMNMIKCKLVDEIDADDAIASMKLRANLLNFKLVEHMPLSEQVAAMGGKTNRIEIFQFCDAMIAAKMVKHSMAFAGYLPCRISLVVDDEGQAWLITLNMDSTMSDADLPDDLKDLGMEVRNNIYSIISAGAEGSL